MLIKSYQPLTNCWDDPPSTPKELPRWNHHQKSTPFDPGHLHLTHFLQVHFAAAIHMGKHRKPPVIFLVKQPMVQPVLGKNAHMKNPVENHAHPKPVLLWIGFLCGAWMCRSRKNMSLDNWVWSRKKWSTTKVNIGGPKKPPRSSSIGNNEAIQ